MNLDMLRAYCLSLPHATEGVQWDNDLLFRVGGKMFAVACLDPATPHRVSFKCTPEEFAELIERDGIIPAPYAARYHWVTLERFDALPDAALRQLIRDSHAMVFARLPLKRQKELTAATTKPPGRSASHGSARKPSSRRSTPTRARR